MAKHTVSTSDGVVLREWDDTTRTFTDHEAGESRPYTEAENQRADHLADTEDQGRTQRSLQDKAVAALQKNDAFLGLNNPTNAQTLAQVKVLTRENNALIRLLLRRLDADDA